MSNTEMIKVLETQIRVQRQKCEAILKMEDCLYYEQLSHEGRKQYDTDRTEVAKLEEMARRVHSILNEASEYILNNLV